MKIFRSTYNFLFFISMILFTIILSGCSSKNSDTVKITKNPMQTTLNKENIKKSSTPKKKLTTKNSPVTLTFAGDVCMSDGFPIMKNYDAKNKGIYGSFSKSLIKLMKDSDIMMLNNEFTYSKRGAPLKNKSYTFRANPKRVSILNDLSVDIVSLANNHVYDYGSSALLDTLSTLKKAKIPYVGAGKNLKEAMKPAYFTINNMKIGIVSASQIERSTLYTKEATSKSPGVLRTLRADKFVKVIKQAKKNCDFVVVYVHWGTENTSNIGSDQRSLAKAYINAGADAIIGAHPHCLQGIEYYKGKPIAYSLGNFWFSKNTQDTGLIELRVAKGSTTKVKFIPCLQTNSTTRLVTNKSSKNRVLNFMRKISPSVKIDNNGFVTKKK